MKKYFAAVLAGTMALTLGACGSSSAAASTAAAAASTEAADTEYMSDTAVSDIKLADTNNLFDEYVLSY